MDQSLKSLADLNPGRFKQPELMLALNAASRQLAELKGVVATMPNQRILISTLGLQEAKDSSEIENIVTTHDELYRNAAFPERATSPEAKEVARYRQALQIGYDAVQKTGILSNQHILSIQAVLEENDAGFRKLPGTKLLTPTGRVVYTPPQEPAVILALMDDLEQFIHRPELFDADPLIKMALMHHQFESIHPFYDGNGRTGRILNVLYLVKEGLLDFPVLYLSRYIVEHKAEYYRLLQAVREADAWEEWVVYMLLAVQATARQSVLTVKAIRELLLGAKHRIRERFRFYSQDLINNLFSYPYTRIEYLQQDLRVSRLTAASYLNQLTEAGFLRKEKVGRSNYYINEPLLRILVG